LHQYQRVRPISSRGSLRLAVIAISTMVTLAYLEDTFRTEWAITPKVLAQEEEQSGTLGFQLGLQAIKSVDSGEDVTGRTRDLFDEAIAVLEREIEEEGYIDPVNHSDRVGILYALYEGCGYWDKALSLFEKILEEGETGSVRHQMAVDLLPVVRERAQASAARGRQERLLLIVAVFCVVLLFVLSKTRSRGAVKT